ncbi:MAG: zinc-binding dehydrogenase [Deltaproteobacteria bacterium]|nr:zinc-binding dehydrogenase [Deltaproteobacteria bacterium]RLB61493.1 MAG: Zn-dependent oxidoreductase [Deltaproteobacteria bacterium]
MKALVYREYAPDDNFASILNVEEVPNPEPKPNEVLIQVKASALNYNDVWGMRGDPIPVPLPHTSGSDAAGDVIGVGSEVTSIKIGDRVAVHANMSCRVCEACTSGREYDCTRRAIWGFQTQNGGLAEQVCLPEVNVVKIPDNVSYEQAAAAAMNLLTAWHMLVGRAQIKPGQVVLIMGGRSGVGHLGIQIAKIYNCTVIATASPENAEACKALGADYVVNHRDEKWAKEVRGICKEIAKNTGVVPGIDVSFDHIGETHWNDQLTLLKYGGILVSCGATTGYNAKMDLRHVFFKGTTILGSTQGTKAELEQGLYWMGRGKIKSAIGAEYSFDQAAEAYKQFISGEGLFGKIILKP